MPARVRLVPAAGGAEVVQELPDGSGRVTAAPAEYKAFVYAYDAGVPILVKVAPVNLNSGTPAALDVEVTEGSSGNRTLSAFDGDSDLVLDSLEAELGTNPADAKSVPGETPRTWPSPTLENKGRWYRGDLHAYSSKGGGSESVQQLVRRAESAGLDFIAIADPNSLASADDAAFQSQKVVLIPTLEWKHPALGSALLYAPASIPPATASNPEAQAIVRKLQFQGTIFAIAHPTTPNGAWQWGLQNPDAIEAWYGEWRTTPPIELNALAPEWTQRNEKKELMHSIAVAAATKRLSANGQAAIYYDIETTQGLRAAVIGGSGSTGKKQALGVPMTYVWAREKSLNAILEGIRLGRTFVTAGPDAPTIEFMADIMADGSTDAGSGGIVPINVKSAFSVGVEGGEGTRVEILFNGYPVKSHIIPDKSEAHRFLYKIHDTPGAVGAYRVRITAPPKEKGYGPSEVLAMSSAIFAQSYYLDPKRTASKEGWIDIESNWEDPNTVKEFDPSALNPNQINTLDAGKSN